MKHARLPEGQLLTFDDDVPDEAIDAHVQKHLAGDQGLAAAQQHNGLVQAGLEVLSQISQSLEVQNQVLAEIVARLDVLPGHIGASADKIHAGLTAPKIIKKDADGKPVGLSVHADSNP